MRTIILTLVAIMVVTIATETASAYSRPIRYDEYGRIIGRHVPMSKEDLKKERKMFKTWLAKVTVIDPDAKNFTVTAPDKEKWLQSIMSLAQGGVTQHAKPIDVTKINKPLQAIFRTPSGTFHFISNYSNSLRGVYNISQNFTNEFAVALVEHMKTSNMHIADFGRYRITEKKDGVIIFEETHSFRISF